MARSTTDTRKIVGVVGYAASGKDTVSSLLTSHGFSHISISETVRDSIYEMGFEPSRYLQSKVANQFRKEKYVGYWIDRSIQKAQMALGDIALSGIYAPGEGDYIVHKLGGVLLGVVVGYEDDLQLRYSRIATRCDGSRDKLSYEDFLQSHERENSGLEDFEANVSSLISSADFVINNSSDDISLERQVKSFVQSLRSMGNVF